MLPKEKRLTSTRDYKRVYQKGLFFSVSLFNLNALPNKTSLTRVGVVVNKKVASKAVQRNQIKRRLREAVGKNYNKIPSGYDMIVSAKGGAVKATFADFEAELKKAIERLKK